MIRLVVATLAEFATVDQLNKLTIGGTIDSISFVRPEGISADAVGPIPVPRLYLVLVLEGSLTDGLAHSLTLRLLDEDKQTVLDLLSQKEFNFQLNQYGRPMRFQAVIQLSGLPVPKPGDYEFSVIVDGRELATTALYVSDDTPSAAE